TLKVMDEVRFDSAFMFKYSERKQTIASRKFPDDVSEEEKTDRMIRLVEMQQKHSLERNRAHIGQTFRVLVEGNGKRAGQLIGRNDGNKMVAFPGTGYKKGDFVNVRIDEVTSTTLIGQAL
ncbi:MAG TPA: TRAM domain-containing protein, partial [Caldithrix abyssi]|nr:TRAM domain-containing protein [Caldithrix abyssi]